METAKVIEAKFFEALAKSNCCAKHRDLVRAFNCKTCGIQLCLSCTYFTAKDFFTKRPAEGPYCLACFRMATVGSKRDHWFSGHDATAEFL
jgi:hypothetical protein